MHPGSFGRRRTDRHPEIAGQPLQLPLKVLPLADAQVVQEVGAAHAAEGRGGELALPLGQVIPQVQVGDEVRVRVGEPAVLVVGLLLRLGRPLARVLDGQRRRDDQHLADAAVPVGFEDHPADARVHGKPGQLAPQAGDVATFERVQLGEEGQSVGDVAGVGRVDEREGGDVAEADGRHLQDHRGQVGAQDLGIGELRPGLEILFGVQPDADAVGGAPAAALALVGRRLRDRLDRQPLNLGPVAVPGDARGARVDDVLDAGHGERGLGHVGRQHHPAGVTGRGAALEDPVLLGGRQPAIQRQHLERRSAGRPAGPRCPGSRARR